MRIAMKRILSMLLCITLLIGMVQLVYANDTETLHNSYVFLTRLDVDGCVKAITAGNYNKSTTTVSKVLNENYEAYPNSWALMKYDISSYSMKDIQKVELVTSANSQRMGTMNIYEVYSDWDYGDTSLSYNLTPIAQAVLNYEAGTETEQTARGFKPITTNPDYGRNIVGDAIYNALTKYEAAFDFTEYVKQKIADGEQTISLAFSGVTGNDYVTFGNISMLITYKNNQLPEIDISNNVTKARHGDSIVFTADVNDPDGEDSIASVIFKINDEIELTAELIDGVYKTSAYDTSNLEGGDYSVKCYATDSKGGVAYKSMYVKIVGLPGTSYYLMTEATGEVTGAAYMSTTGVIKEKNANWFVYPSTTSGDTNGGRSLINYDFSTMGAYDIQKVEILTTLTNLVSGSPVMNIYKVTQPWEIGGTLVFDDIAVSTPSITYTAPGDGEKNTGLMPTENDVVKYSRSISNDEPYSYETTGLNLDIYDHAVDITEYTKNMLDNGETTLRFYYASDSWLCCRKIDILVTYKNNLLPAVDIRHSIDNGQLVITSNITEPDDDLIESIEFTFDGETIQPDNTGTQYTYTCDAMKIGTGVHTFTVSASDEWGAEKKKTLVIDNTYPVEMAYASIFDAQDTGALIAALNNTEAMLLIGISSELYSEVTDKAAVAENIKAFIQDNKTAYENGSLDNAQFNSKADIMLNKEAILELVKESDGKTLQGLLDKYSAYFEKEEYLNITTVPAYNNLYKNWDEDIKIAVCEILVSYDINSIDDILQNLPEAIYLGGIKGTNYWGDVYEIINSNTDYFGEKNTVVNTLTNKAAVYSKMMGVSYKSYAEVKKAEAEYADIQYQAENSNTTSGGGGGSSKRGSTSNGGTYIPPANNNTTDTQETEVIFDDMEQYGWVKVAVEVLAEKGIVNGVGDKKFNPGGNVKREEFIKMLVCAFEIYDAGAKTTFNDVLPGNWSESYIASAENYGLVNGVGNGIFGYGNYITREDMIVMCMNFANKFNVSFNNVDETKVLNFADSVNISDYAKTAVETMYRAGMVNGVGNNMFKPKDYCTRAEAAKVIYEIYAAK